MTFELVKSGSNSGLLENRSDGTLLDFQQPCIRMQLIMCFCIVS